MIIPIFKGQIKDGKLLITDPDLYGRYLISLGEKEVEVVVRARRKHRSNKENRYMHGVVIPMVAQEMAIEDDEAKEFLKAKFLKKTIEYKGKEYEIIRGTASLSTTEMEWFLEKCKRWAAEELSIFIPDPNQVEFEI